MTMTFSPRDSWVVAQRRSQHSLYQDQPSWRKAPYDFCDIPRQVHSLLKKGLSDNVQDVCTTEQPLTP